MQTKISVTILAKNAQNTLRACLESLRGFDEVILLDNKSEDETQSIAREFANVRIFESEFIGFGPLKNVAASYAKNEWILSLDSDEILEAELYEAIQSTHFKRGYYYSFLRKNYYRGQWMKCCGWHPDWVKRIFNKEEILFKDDLVHEGLKIPKHFQEKRLNGGVRHLTCESIGMVCEKMNRYTSLSAIEAHKRGKKGSILGALVRFVFVFVRDYVFRMGWRYGYKGFIIAWFNANGSMLKYMKIYELNED